MSDCKCKQPCGPCSNNCPDDGEILKVDILDTEDCNTSCCWKSCKDNCWINIQSTNDCLVVDTSECWVIKLTAECPKPTYVKAWENITVTEVTPPSDCYIDWEDCWIKGWWKISSTDEKVKACSWDSTPWYLNQKLQAWENITIEPVGCDWSNSKIRISAHYDCPEYDYPEIKVNNTSKLITTSYGWPEWHTIWISDKENTFYDNNVCIGFDHDLTRQCTIDSVSWNMNRVDFIEWDWNRCTWNTELATKNWIKIKASWYYRITWQLTVQFNVWTECYLNLWRWFLKITWAREVFQYVSWLSTAKHWGYTISPIMYWGNWIKTDNMWTISVTWTVGKSIPEWWGTVQFTPQEFIAWQSQARSQLDWPWATYNMDCLVDLEAGDVITLWWRWQGSMLNSEWMPPYNTAHYRFVWFGDQSTEFQSIFWWTTLSAQMIAPKTFQWDTTNKLRDKITQ